MYKRYTEHTAVKKHISFWFVTSCINQHIYFSMAYAYMTCNAMPMSYGLTAFCANT